MNELREEALRMVAELTGYSIGYTKMQIGTKGHFVTLETAAVSMAERALKAELANREQKVTLADRDNHIDLAYKALGDVNRSVYLFDHIREQKAEIERLNKSLHQARSEWAEEKKRALESEVELASLRASVGEKWIEIKEGCEMPPLLDSDEYEYAEVMVYSPRYPEQHLGRYRISSNTWTFSGSNSDFTDCITHWQPIPAPPTLPGEEK